MSNKGLSRLFPEDFWQVLNAEKAEENPRIQYVTERSKLQAVKF